MCIRRQKSRTDVTWWGKWHGDGSDIEEEELLEQKGDKEWRVMKNLHFVDAEEVEDNKEWHKESQLLGMYCLKTSLDTEEKKGDNVTKKRENGSKQKKTEIA